MKQQLTPIMIPVIADYVLSPIVIYGEVNFETKDEEFGRFTPQNTISPKIAIISDTSNRYFSILIF